MLTKKLNSIFLMVLFFSNIKAMDQETKSNRENITVKIALYDPPHDNKTSTLTISKSTTIKDLITLWEKNNNFPKNALFTLAIAGYTHEKPVSSIANIENTTLYISKKEKTAQSLDPRSPARSYYD